MVRLKKLPAVYCLIMLLFLSGVAWGQNRLPAGEASLTIQMGSEKKTFTFPKAVPTITMAVQNSAGAIPYTDISYSRFMDDKEMEFVSVHLAIEPTGPGNFIVPNLNTTLPNNATIDITYRKKNANFELKELILLGDNSQEGVSGTAEISQYAIGSDLIGSFQATLRDLNGSGIKGDFYKVSGNFKIKLTKE
ncbi:MAG TPA: hypothetical protein VGP43_04400 [Chitinophagaceae bacterium]|nr:hypothetical protein [Chitinophagaceae bacterium]